MVCIEFKLNLPKLILRARIIKLHLYRKLLNSSKKELLKWDKTDRRTPPPAQYKQEIIKKYARTFSTKTFIETGTFLGDTVDAVKTIFDHIYSIELDKNLCDLARLRFSRFKNISIIQGNSGKVLGELLKGINSACLFWLDGHYSHGITAKGELETPIMQELRHIFLHPIKAHVILIDDARCFVGKNDYPTIKRLKRFCYSFNRNLSFEIKDDIIRITTKPQLKRK